MHITIATGQLPVKRLLPAARSSLVPAEEYLSFAYSNCHVSSQKNIRLILIYLIPVKMLLGRLPPLELLHAHGLDQFVDIVKAVRQVALFELFCWPDQQSARLRFRSNFQNRQRALAE